MPSHVANCPAIEQAAASFESSAHLEWRVAKDDEEEQEQDNNSSAAPEMDFTASIISN